MSIEFIRDEFLEGKKEELDKINEVLSEKHKKTDRHVLFLRRFTLALMGQYKIHKKLFDKKHEEIEMLNKQIFQGVNFQKIPVAPSPRIQIPRPQIQIPKPMTQPKIKIPSPLKEELKTPEPIISETPKEMLKVKLSPILYIGTTDDNHQKTQEKKEIPTPI